MLGIIDASAGRVNYELDSMDLSLVPGPTRMLPNVLAAQGSHYGSPDTEAAFWDDYLALEATLQQFLHTKQSVVIQSGEGMLGLWGAMKSTIERGDTVVCAANGLFGEGFADMAKGLGAEVFVVKGDWKQTMDVEKLIEEIKLRNPKLVTMVHCETPSGVLNSLEGVGDAIEKYTTDGLFLVDFVSSAIGAPLNVDELKIDLGLLAPQKALSGPASLAITTVSDKAWKRIAQNNYVGYDALLPFHQVEKKTPRLFPYTHNWHAVRATMAACDNIINEGGIDAVLARHREVSAFCREESAKLGLKLYCGEKAASPTVTALEIPEWCEWSKLQEELRQQKVFLGGSYGPLHGKVMRIGHMGTQADKQLVSKALRILGQVLHKLK
uniref:alanine--glyoxylate transaminase n=1 Tax=Globisporangium ultimum (strain ATCC 200006 / CBS 805.95 / DAOM BR144) TaxID=431595 RepID=K3X5R3_GLOUD